MLKKLFIILLSLLVLLLPVTCYAESYTITPQELTTLELELARAQKAIENCRNSSAELQIQLAKSKAALSEAQTQLQELKQQLEGSQVTLALQQTQLQNANESLQTLNAEMKKERRSLERQRNIAYIIAAGMLYAAIN